MKDILKVTNSNYFWVECHMRSFEFDVYNNLVFLEFFVINWLFKLENIRTMILFSSNLVK